MDIENGITILDNLVDCIKTINCINDVCLGISEGVENKIYIDIANKKINYIVGDEHDVLDRLIQCGKSTGATDIFRVTSEDPFLYYEEIELRGKSIFLRILIILPDNIIDGIGFSITKLSAFEISHKNGNKNHRSEFCNLYIRENMEKFNTIILPTPETLIRKDLRLTVDYPEDLIVCRKIYAKLKNHAPRIPIDLVINFLDENPELIKLIEPYTEIGYSTMY